MSVYEALNIRTYINAVDPQTLHYLDALTCPLAIMVE